MKSIRALIVFVFSALSINVFAAGSISIKNGGTDVTGKSFSMPQVNKAGDTPSSATLTVQQSGMKSVWLSVEGDDAISANLSDATLSLLFNPTDSAGQYSSVITVKGLDTDNKAVSASVTVTAICLWGEITFQILPVKVTEGASSDYRVIIHQTSYNKLSRCQIISKWEDCIGSPFASYKLNRDLKDAGIAEYLKDDGHTLSASILESDVPASGSVGVEVIFTDDKGAQCSKCVVTEAGVSINSETPIGGFDLASCFDVYGKTVMDSLYLLSDALCLVYAPNASKTQYEFSDSYDPRAKKRVIKAESHKNLYFSGKCTSAYTGADGYSKVETITLKIEGYPYNLTNLDGAFNFVGSLSPTDVYIENLQITAKARNTKDSNNGMNFLGMDMPGASNVFSVVSLRRGLGGSGEVVYYDVNFHLKGDNKLTSNHGVKFYLNFKGYATVRSDAFVVASAPIAIRSTMLDDKNNSTEYQARLQFDDYWHDGVSTNGSLSLSTNGQTNVGSIDLGNSHGVCNFYGGRYKIAGAGARVASNVYLADFANPAYASYFERPIDYFMYNSLAINYRLFQMTISLMLAPIEIGMYGFGNDMVNPGQVNIYGGTFETYGVSDEYINDESGYCYYRGKHDLRLPHGGNIFGGGFNGCDLYMCDTVSSYGFSPSIKVTDTPDDLCKLSIPVSGSKADGTAVFEIPAKFKYTINGRNIMLNDTLGIDGIINTTAKHGVNADASGNVNVYVPCDMDESLDPAELIKNKKWWVNLFPKYSANPTGETTADTSDDTYNCFFADVIIDSLVYKKGNVPSIKFTTYRGKLTNKDNVDIQRRLYIVMPVETNRWYNFVAPFDISNVYEVNTTQFGVVTSTLETDRLDATKQYYKTDTFDIHSLSGRQKITAEKWKEYQNTLCDNNYNLILSFAPQLIFGGHEDLIEMLQNVGDTLFIANKKRFELKALTAYDGTNAADAHYYLYYPADSTDRVVGVWNIKDGAFNPDWQYVAPITKTYKDVDGVTIKENAKVVMQAKNVYGLCFPGSQKFPYWNNRYIIFEGYGRQTVYGSDEQANFVTTAATGKGQWGGNYTFTNYAVTPNMYSLDTKIGSSTIGKYILASSAVAGQAEGVVKEKKVNYITPNHSYLVANGVISAPEYDMGMGDADDDEDRGDAPHIDEVSFMVNSADGLTVKTNKPQTIFIYNMQGQMIFRRPMTKDEVIHLGLMQGVYVVSGATDNVKVTIR